MYYKIKFLGDIEATLHRIGGNELIHSFKWGPFGHFLGWSPGESYNQYLHSILCRAVFSNSRIVFFIRQRYVKYTIHDHALVTGLSFGMSQFDPNVVYTPSQSHICDIVCSGTPGTAKELWDNFKADPSPFVDNDGEIHVCLANLLMANFIHSRLQCSKTVVRVVVAFV